MDYFEIVGKNHLEGNIVVSGAKNAVLPIMAASILNNSSLKIKNVPTLSDSKTMAAILESMGSKVSFSNNETINIDNSGLNIPFASYDLVRTMRASFYVLGPLLARFKQAKVSLPGGCAWGPRPVDFHINAFEQLGVKIDLENGYVVADASNIKGGKIHFPKISVGATGNVLMLAVLADGVTVITNAAAEPEIQQLCQMLNNMGADISGIGTNTLTIKGVSSLKNLEEISIIPDRIEAGTFMIATAAVGGKVVLENVNPLHLKEVTKQLMNVGINVIEKNNIIEVHSEGDNIKFSNIETNEYPGFPTDLQAQWMILMCLANGDSTLKENIYFDRFTHILELNRLGCKISLEGSLAKIKGNRNLIGANVMSTDIRASAALIIAALCAEGKTSISRVYHIDRGYDKIEEKLTKLGAQIIRKK